MTTDEKRGDAHLDDMTRGEGGDIPLAELFDRNPFAARLGLRAVLDGEGVLCTMPFSAQLIGNPSLPALHGGIVATFLEATALATVMHAQRAPENYGRCGQDIPRVISTTVDYLRPGGPRDTFGQAQIIRLGARLSTVVATVWQDNRDKPVARANCHFLVAAQPAAKKRN